ncbi:hypothetical protein BDZ88DRAFT_269050 [Geranomyces variabilis]|nr:hypothetical protein BDZ88DRAFT_269050 [Geranomyces variabilis]
MPLLPPDKTDTALAGSVPAAAVQQNGDVALAGLVPAAAAQQEGGVALAGFDATAVATATADNPTPDTERNEDPTKFGPATSISQKLLANLGWRPGEPLREGGELTAGERAPAPRSPAARLMRLAWEFDAALPACRPFPSDRFFLPPPPTTTEKLPASASNSISKRRGCSGPRHLPKLLPVREESPLSRASLSVTPPVHHRMPAPHLTLSLLLQLLPLGETTTTRSPLRHRLLPLGKMTVPPPPVSYRAALPVKGTAQ